MKSSINTLFEEIQAKEIKRSQRRDYYLVNLD